MTFVTRFAPSPSGHLHRGHAFSAITAHEAAERADGRFLLRIDDIDAGRCRPAFEAAIYEDLAWLGLAWEAPVRRQSDHLADYARALEALDAEHLIYRCFKTRKEAIADIGRAPHDPGSVLLGEPLGAAEEARRLGEGRPFAWRLSLARAEARIGGAGQLTFEEAGGGRIAVDSRLIGDPILARKDLGVAYHLAVVVDDAMQGVTDVIRGADLLQATHCQRLLQALLGLPTPRYRHHRLILGADGKRLAKRDQAETLRDLRSRGVSPADVRRELGL